MSLKIKTELLNKFVSDDELRSMQSSASEAFEKTVGRTGAGAEFLGWLDLPEKQGSCEYKRILAAAEKIRSMCDVLVVIGIGGSYLGARAAIEFLYGPKYNLINRKNSPQIFFVGCDLNAQTISDVLQICEGKDVCVNVISKSGTTTEPAVAFRFFREYMVNRYKESAAERIFVTTDKSRGKLKALADMSGYETFVVPDDVGGRYSVLSPVGLLPIAVSGADIGKILEGARDAKSKYSSPDIFESDCCKYAAIRNILYNKGKKSEVFVSYDAAAAMMGEWWKQLYGESEGKQGKGLFPASVSFTTDLHSLGQFIQQGSDILFETVLSFASPVFDLTLPFDNDDNDSLNYISGKQLSWINSKALEATCAAHTEGNVPNIIIELDSRSEYDFGWLVYFFEFSCAISGYMLGINPFDQPGVEMYKKNMFALLGKTGPEFDAIRNKLNFK